MSNLFILSNTYDAHTFLACIDYVLNFSVDSVGLLQENHHENELFMIDHKVPIIFYDTLHQGISNCDVVIVIQNSYMAQAFIDTVLNLSREFEKRCIILDNPSEYETINMELYKMDAAKIYNKPFILLISDGDYTQQYCTEVLLHREFNRLGIRARFCYSARTNYFLHHLKKEKILNSDIKIENMNELLDPCDVVVWAEEGNFFERTSESVNFINKLHLLQPDYILLNINARAVISDGDKELFTARYGFQIDSILVSQFIPVVGKGAAAMPIYLINTSESTSQGNISNEFFKCNIITKILQRISLPDDVFVIKYSK